MYWHMDNLKYCEDIISMDVGHMSLTELEFLRYMPNLKYLDVSLNHLLDISPLAECKSLVFLTMFLNSIDMDYSPLKELTALEDLNIGGNSGDISPILEMKHLKNLWIVFHGNEEYQMAQRELPDTHIGYYHYKVDEGWRRLPNYFKMRDALLMFYMA